MGKELKSRWLLRSVIFICALDFSMCKTAPATWVICGETVRRLLHAEKLWHNSVDFGVTDKALRQERQILCMLFE